LPSEDSIKRLPFIRYLYSVALQQSRQPKPMNAASILTFHDSIELFLHLSCRDLGINVKKDIAIYAILGSTKKSTKRHKLRVQVRNGYSEHIAGKSKASRYQAR
jgi:hypothetical protein